ncbi:MAG: DUF302 domain-containing protein [Proteobacteria bacterium]|nr:DUF302 domain-containing protein [Pseudomonadota bacterium]
MNKLSRVAGAAVLIALMASSHADDGMVSVASKYSVAETMDRLEFNIRKTQPPINVFARVDLQSTAASQGGAVRPTQVLIFGRGAVSATLLPQYPTVGLDLPLKALVWEDAQGKVWLTYNTGEYLMQRHKVAGRDDLAKRLSEFTAGLAKSATE